MISDIDCLHQLYPQVVSTRDDKAFDKDGNEVAYDKAAVQALYESYAYQAKRAAEYPSFADQFDTIFHEGIDAWKAQIQAVKDRYPKS
jgi:predicted lipoprotein